MVATAIYFVTMVLWKGTAFPLCRAIEKRWNRNVVFCDGGDTPANLLCELNGHLMPCTSCLYCKLVEDVCTGQFAVFVYLVLRCLLVCGTWFSCCAANVGLSICVWYCHVPGHWLSSGPWQESGRLLSSHIRLIGSLLLLLSRHCFQHMLAMKIHQRFSSKLSARQ